MSFSAKVLLATCGSWWLPHTAKAYEARRALSGFWISDNNKTGIPRARYKRCWPFHLAMKPFYHCAPQIITERAFYAFFPIWRSWILTQRIPAECNVLQGLMGYCTELFSLPGNDRCLRVIDCPNSHPTSYYGFWQRECDLWCPGESVPIPQWMFARMNRELDSADLIICPSTFVKDSMVANGIPQAKCFVNPFGVDLQLSKPRSLVPTAPKFVCAGTICVRKGYQYLFRAFQLVRKVIPNAELICVGDYKRDFGKEKPKWIDVFTHIPHTDQATLAAILQKCTAFVFPSQEEGFARVLSLAMGAGLPIIASHESGATTLVEDGIEGFIVRGRDPQHIADAMIQVFLDPDLNRKMGNAAYKKGASKNTWQDYGDRLLKRIEDANDHRQ